MHLLIPDCNRSLTLLPACAFRMTVPAVKVPLFGGRVRKVFLGEPVVEGWLRREERVAAALVERWVFTEVVRRMY